MRVIACRWAPGMVDPAKMPGRATRTYLLRIGGRVREVEETGNTCDGSNPSPEPRCGVFGAKRESEPHVRTERAYRGVESEGGAG
jgi:hypothetical protein